MPTIEAAELQQLARARTRDLLAQSSSFRNMPVEDQKSLYMATVKAEYDTLARQHGLAGQMAASKASDNINDARHEKSFQDGVDSFEDLVDSVDFPKFVSDLLEAVFKANINVMKAQTDDYIRLMKAATTDLAQFIKQVDNTAAFAYLAENKPSEFNMTMEEDENGNQKMALTNPEGEKVDMDDNQVKAKIMEAKIAMAQEHRTALREMILMGITRLVVEKGKIKAGVLFEFKGTRNVQKSDKAMNQTTTTDGFSGGISGGLLGSIFGGPRFGGGRSSRSTNISVSSAKSTANDELSARLSGEVEINFKTDYFKLDNFAAMYGPVTNAQAAPAAGAAPAQGQLPPRR